MPSEAPRIVYLCGVCGSGEHFNAMRPLREFNPQSHGMVFGVPGDGLSPEQTELEGAGIHFKCLARNTELGN